jgi:hypothetical protein
MNLDDRLRAAGAALQEGSVTQVDAASRLREIIAHRNDLVPRARGAVLVDEPPPRSIAVSPVPPAQTRVARRSRRWAVLINLLVVLGIGVALGLGVSYGKDMQSSRPAPPASTVVTTRVTTRVKIQAPPACLKANELANEVIGLLVGRVRDHRVGERLKAYTTAAHQCQRSASP